MSTKLLMSPFYLFALLVSLLGYCCGQVAAESVATGQQQIGEADVVYKNGLVYTVDAVRSRAQAFALRDGKFLVVGSNDDMKAVTGKDTKIIDLKGKMVLPGLADSKEFAVPNGERLGTAARAVRRVDETIAVHHIASPACCWPVDRC